jgi:hypothetical protein
MGSVNYLPGLAPNCDPPNLSLPSVNHEVSHWYPATSPILGFPLLSTAVSGPGEGQGLNADTGKMPREAADLNGLLRHTGFPASCG